MHADQKDLNGFLRRLSLFVLIVILVSAFAGFQAQPVQAGLLRRKTPTPTVTPTVAPSATPTLSGTPTPTPIPGPNGTWNVVSSPNTGWARNYLHGVSGVATNDVWLVGDYEDANSNGWQVIQHWNGTQWSFAKSPALTTPSELMAVTAIVSNDVWAVGGYDTGGQSLIEHWNGSTWSVVTNPNPGIANRFLGVAASSSNDVWAVGYFFVDGNSVSQNLIEHWNGTSWSVIPSPDLGTGYNQLNAVAAVPGSPNNVWAVGTAGSSTLIEHWNGTQWSIVSSPNTGTNPELEGVAAISANDVWAVGWTGGSSGQLTVTMHWNGTQWSIVSSPNPSSTQDQLFGVAALGTNNVWAVGNFIDTNVGVPQTLFLQWNGTNWVQVPGDNSVAAGLGPQPAAIGAIAANDIWSVGTDGSALAEHWNGSSWSIASTPNAGNGDNVLNGVSGTSSTDIWQVGSFGAGLETRTLTEHWNGTQWSVVPSPNSNLETNVLKAVVAISSSNAWAVGYSENNNVNGSTTLILHWDGTRWSLVPSPSPNPGTGQPVDELDGIAANSASDIWAVGHMISSDIGTSETLIEHWNGSSWSVIPSPNISGTHTALFAVTALSANEVWAVGFSGANSFSTLTEHWNGSNWSIVPSAGTGGSDILYAVSGTGANDVWAVGQSGSPSAFVTLIEHWNGSNWNIVPSVNQIQTDTDTLRGAAAVSSGDAWAVGTDSTYPLIERWNGSSWSIFTSPKPSGGGASFGMTEITSCDLWAVGRTYVTNIGFQTLDEHFTCN